MKSKNLGLMPKENFQDLSREELIRALETARQETFKYINKFLEAEEKWAFINVLLKKLNSIKQKQELCKTICEGFLKLTDSKVCYGCFFNQDNNSVEVAKVAYGNQPCNKQKLMNFIKEVDNECFTLLEKSTEPQKILEYFKSRSGGETIVFPIIYLKTFLGYFLLVKEDINFYRENRYFVNIFPEHIALILENISLYQESEKRNKRKMEFLAGISHEFRTPLNSIIGFAEVLKSKDKNEQNSKYIENISQSSKHLLTLIEDVLDVSKSQYNALDLNYSVFNAKEEVIQVVQTLEQMIEEKNLKFTYTLCEVKISADKKRFRQLIYNLVSNAVKFNKQGGAINIITYINDNKFFFEITDTGDGISKRNYEKIFDFFSQVNRSQLKRQLGSGVGLAICKMITDAHNGEINFKSQLKKGSSFWFSLPINY